MIDLVASTGVCSKCRERKSLIDFPRNPQTRSGRDYRCKPCLTAYTRSRLAAVSNMDRTSQMPEFDLDAPVSYMAAHLRIHYWRGRASIHRCHCGAQADQWAYRHDSQHERSAIVPERDGSKVEVLYSPDPMDYVPMCHGCHVSFDKSQKRVSA